MKNLGLSKSWRRKGERRDVGYAWTKADAIVDAVVDPVIDPVVDADGASVQSGNF